MADTSEVPYDEQSPQQQADTRRRWDADIAATRAALNYAERFAAEGRPYVEAAPDGSVVYRDGAR
ncbi:hypothetical protein [Aeromicrobium sp.]|uniref:hypothetical protein n=1 Tax=Aeromicrobium sp. TaxID=1871063 RepID=UPI0035159ABD